MQIYLSLNRQTVGTFWICSSPDRRRLEYVRTYTVKPSRESCKYTRVRVQFISGPSWSVEQLLLNELYAFILWLNWTSATVHVDPLRVLLAGRYSRASSGSFSSFPSSLSPFHSSSPSLSLYFFFYNTMYAGTYKKRTANGRCKRLLRKFFAAINMRTGWSATKNISLDFHRAVGKKIWIFAEK